MIRTDSFLTTSRSGVDVENGARYDMSSNCVFVQARFVLSSRENGYFCNSASTTAVKINGFACQYSCPSIDTRGFLLFHKFGIQSHSGGPEE